MAIIDKKGRVFGVINLFDLFVLCAIGLAALFIFKWTVIAEDPSWVKVQTVHVRCEAVTAAPYYVADLMREGDVMVNDTGQVVARIEKIIKIDPMKIRISVYMAEEDENLFMDEDNRKVTLVLDMLAYEKRGVAYSYAANSPINAGLALMFNAKNYSVKMSFKKILEVKP